MDKGWGHSSKVECLPSTCKAPRFNHQFQKGGQRREEERRGGEGKEEMWTKTILMKTQTKTRTVLVETGGKTILIIKWQRT